MAACIVCNQEIGSQDLNVSNVATVCSRLENVLEEAVPGDAVLCSSCDFDLSQIETYYTLLASFRRRYYDTANKHRQQMKYTQEQTHRNFLHESTEFSSKNLQVIFEASDDNLLPLKTETSKETCSSDISPDNKLEINDVRSLQGSQQQNQMVQIEAVSDNRVIPQKWQEENQNPPQQPISRDSDTDDALDQEDFIETEDLVLPNLIGASSDNTQPKNNPTESDGKEAHVKKSDTHDTPADLQTEVTAIDAAVGGSKVVKRKRGRPRKYRQIEFPISSSISDSVRELSVVKKEGMPSKATLTGVVKGTGSTVVSRKPGRPRKNDNVGFIPITETMIFTKEKGRQSRNKESNMVPSDESIALFKKRGKPQKHVGAAPVQKKKLGRPRKNEHAGIKTVTSEKSGFTEAGVEEYNADVPTLNESHQEPMSPSNMPTNSSVMMSPAFKRQRGRPRKVLDPVFGPVQHSKLGRKEKKVENTTGKTKTSPACPICDEVFPDRPSLKAHMITHIGDKTVFCSFCGKEFPSPSALEQHESVHTGKKRFQCEICGKGISRGSSLRMHLSSHNEVNSFECDKCNKKFKNQKYLESHINKHHVQGRHILCTVCGKAFFTEKVLKIHMLMHSGERVKSFKCKFCDMRFYTKGELGHHEGTHKDKTERQKHKCPVCGKAFVQKSYLKYHMVSHTGESKHRCTECDQVFKTASEHQRHMRLHTGEKPYKCSVCGKAFRISSNLHAHKKLHTGERPHKCICGASFPVKTMLDRHMGTKKHADFIEKMSGTQPTSVPMVAPGAATEAMATGEQHDFVTAYQSSPMHLGLYQSQGPNFFPG